MNAKPRRAREWRPSLAYSVALALNALGSPVALLMVIAVAAVGGLKLAEAPLWTLPTAAAIGAIVVLGVWAFRARHRLVRSLDNLNEQLGVGVFGGAPEVSMRVLRQLPPDRRTAAGLIVDRPEAPLAVAFRTLFERVTRAFGVGGQVVLVAPVAREEQRNHFALLLATTAAAVGRKVIIVDGDLQNRALSGELGFDGQPGVWDIVKGQNGWRDVVYAIEDYGVDAICAGSPERSVRETYADPRYAALLNELRAHYDVVIVETPGAVQGPDARMTAAHSDVAVLVALWGKTSLMEARRAANAIYDRAPHVRVGLAVANMRERLGI